MGLKERLIKFIEYKGFEKASFERICDLSNGFVDKAGENTRKSSLDKISNKFPDLNMVWLRTGAGDMLNDKMQGGNITTVKTLGDGNITAIGKTGGDINLMLGDANTLKQRIEELEAILIQKDQSIKELQNDKAILQEFISFLQKK